MKNKIAFLMLSTVLIFSGCGQTAAPDKSATEAATAEDTIMIDQTYHEGFIGDTMSTAFFDFTIDAVFTNDLLGSSTPDDGKDFLVAKFDIRNTSSEPISMSSEDFQVQWGDNSDSTAFATPIALDDISVDSYLLPNEYTLQPDEEKIGYYVFEVPEGSVNMNISYLEQYTDGTQGDVYFIFFDAQRGSFETVEEEAQEEASSVETEDNTTESTVSNDETDDFNRRAMGKAK